MYCPTCRQERVGGFAACVSCGAILRQRSREEVSAELEHINFLLADMGRWSESDVSVSARKYVRNRYQQMARVLRAVLETPEGQTAEVRSWQEPEPKKVPVAGPEAESAKAARGESAAEAAKSTYAEARPNAPQQTHAESPAEARSEAHAESHAEAHADSTSTAHGTAHARTEPAAHATSRSNEQTDTSGSAPNNREDAPELPPTPFPAFDVPLQPSASEQLLEEASSWKEIWKPFLYERIGWFIGAFLILAGSFYFVAVSWSGMSALMQTLVVFGLTAGYSTAFGVGGALLGKRENFENAGRVLMLIGAAIAPLANLALHTTDGVQQIVSLPIAIAWAFAAAVLFGVVAKRIDESSQRPLQMLMLLSAAVMGLAPLLAPFGTSVLWLNAAPLLLIHRAWNTKEKRTAEAIWFLLAAPAYLFAVFAIRLHVALDALHNLPPFGTYAPFLSVLLGSALQLRKLDEKRSADALSASVVAAQVALLFGSGFGEAPALFVSCASLAFTCWQLSRGSVARTRWLYGTYVAAQLAYQTCGQLVPGVLTKLIVEVKRTLGYSATAPLPFNFDSVYALPFVLAAAAYAVLLVRRSKDDRTTREGAVAEVLLRSTAGASALFTAFSFAGSDHRAALWSVPLFVVLCLGLGQWFSRSYLVITGALLAVTVPIFSLSLYGAPAAGILTGISALLLAAFSIIQTKETRGTVSIAAGLLALSAVGLGWVGAPPQLSGVLAVVLGGSAGLLVARNLDRREFISLSSAVLVSAVPLFFLHSQPEAAPFSVAVAALALALIGGRGGRFESLDVVAAVGAAVACCWCWVIGPTAASLFHIPLLGPTLVTAGLAMLTLSRRELVFRPVGAALLALAAFPVIDGAFVTWSFMTPALSASLLMGVALLSSVLAARKGRDTTNVTLALLALLGSGLAAGLTFSDSGWPFVATVGIAAVAALFTARALHPSFSLPWATAIALLCLAPNGHSLPMLALAMVLSLVALLPEWKRLHSLLLGEESVSVAASLSAAAVLLTIAAKVEPFANPIYLAVYALLPLLWVRGARSGWLALFSAPLLALFIAPTPHPESMLWIVPLVLVLTTRFVAQTPFGASLVCDEDETLQRRFVRWSLIGYALTALAVVVFVCRNAFDGGGIRPEEHVLLLAFASGFAFAAGTPLWVRLGAATGVSALVPWMRPLLMPALIGVGFAAHHLPKATHALFGAEEDDQTPSVLAVFAIAITLLPWLSGWANNSAVLLTAASLLAGSLLLRARWLISAGLILAASTSLGFEPLSASWLIHGVRPEALALMALATSALSALLSNEAVNLTAQAWSRLIAPGFEKDLRAPLWLASIASIAAAVCWQLPELGEHTLSLPMGAALFVSGALLAVTKERAEAAVAVALMGAVIIISVPFAWVPVALGGFGLAVCALGARLEGRIEIADALHHSGWVAALAAVFFNRSLHHVATPLSFGLGALTAWIVVRRRPGREAIAWIVSLLAGHVLLFHLGVVLSTGMPATYIFPYIGALSAIAAACALSFASMKIRRAVGLSFAILAGLEVLGGIVLLPLGATEVAMREAFIAAFGMAALVIALTRRAVKENDVAAAYLAQGALLLGYLALRLHGFVPHHLGTGDAVGSVIAGAIFSGLYGWARRQDSAHVLLGPSWLGAVGLPLLGLFVAPWHQPLVAAALLIGYAAHFAAAARNESHRRMASLLSVGAFNAALVFVWLGTGFGRPQYYVIPAALSLIALVRIFRDDFETATAARLRAAAVTAIYLASAWPVLFDTTGQMLACATICVIGVAAGVALRIRSYVYLGTGFLVSTIVANLARFGVRDPRLGAVFLSLLGLLIVGFMIYVTARRAEVLSRYNRVRQMLAEWDG